MFDAFSERLDRLANIDIDEIFMRVMAYPEMQTQIVLLNKAQLNDQGVFADGEPTGDYSEAYAKKRVVQGLQADHIDLKDTGYLQSTMEVTDLTNEGWTAAAVVIKADMVKNGFDLSEHYPNALGLTDESIDKLRPLFNELFIAEYQKEVNYIMYGTAA